MAQVTEPVAPDVNPQTHGIDVNANPEEFGALIAKGVETFGADLKQIGEKYGQVAAQDATNTAQKRKNEILYGVPGKTVQGPNGEQIPDTGFFGLQGADAMRAREGVMQQLDEIDKDARGGLLTLDAQRTFDDESRRWRFYMEGMVGRHADEQQKSWMLNTSETTSTLALNDAAADPLNPNVTAKALEDNRKAQVRIAQLRGDTDATGAVLKADQQVTLARLRALDINNPKAAYDLFNTNAKTLGSLSNYDAMGRQIREAYARRMIATASEPQTAAPGASVAERNLAANNPGNLKVPGSKTEFQSFKTRDEGIAAVGKQIDLYRGRGIDTIQKIVSTYAPAEDHNDVAAYVADVSKRTGIQSDAKISDAQVDAVRDAMIAHEQGPAGSRSRMAMAQSGYLNGVRAQAEAAFGATDPEMVEFVVRGTEENLKRDGAIASEALEVQAKDAIGFLANRGDPALVSITPDQIRNSIPGVRGETQAQELDAALEYGRAVRTIATATPDQLKQILQEHEPKGPEGFEAADKTYGALVKAAVERQEELYGGPKTPADPGGYVLRAFPDVAAAYQAASAKGATPVQFQAFAQKMLASQTTLGIEPRFQRILPAEDARADVQAITTGNPGNVLPFFQGLRQHSGSYWPQVYSDLARAGLSPAYQAIAVMADGAPTDVKNAQTMAAALSRDAESRTQKNAPIAEALRGVKYDDGTGGAPKSVTDLVEQQLSKNAPLSDLRATYGVFGRTGARDFENIFDAVRATALYLFQTRSIAPQDAADIAAAMVTSPFDFKQQPGHPPLRLPKGQSDDFDAASKWTLSHLDPAKLAPIHSQAELDAARKAGDVNFEADAQAQAQEGAAQAYWVAVPGSRGETVARAFNPFTDHPVMLKTGAPLDIPMSRIPLLAQEGQTTERRAHRPPGLIPVERR